MLSLITSSNVLADEHVIQQLSALYKGSLTGVSDAREYCFNSLAEHFGNAFIEYIATRNRSKFGGLLGVLHFR